MWFSILKVLFLTFSEMRGEELCQVFMCFNKYIYKNYVLQHIIN